MRTESEICREALDILNKNLGTVETEVFISVLLREHFDYTSWQRSLWKDKSMEQIFSEAKKYEQDHLSD